MSVLFGSARSSSFGNDRQVSIQDYYTHNQGYWLGFEPKKNAKKLASAMRDACNNQNIIYSQDRREEAWNQFDNYGSIANIGIKVHTDCSALVRLCIRQAMKTKLGNFNTESEPKVLDLSGLFKSPRNITSASQCTTGMVLCSPRKGHTGIIIQADKTSSKNGIEIPSCIPNLHKGSMGKQVRLLQACLNIVMKSDLEVDGIFGKQTDKVLRDFQKKNNLQVDGIYGSKSKQKLQDKLK